MLRDLNIMDDDERDIFCKQAMISAQSTLLRINKFRQYEVLRHFDDIEMVRDRLSEIMDKAQRK